MSKRQTGKDIKRRMGIQTGAGAGANADGSALEKSRVGISCHSERIVSPHSGGLRQMTVENPDANDYDESEGNQRKSELGGMNAHQQRELEKVANQSTTTAILLGIFITPLAYVYVGKWGWAALNFFTLNFLLTGFVVVPIHTRKMINDANEQLHREGVEGY